MTGFSFSIRSDFLHGLKFTSYVLVASRAGYSNGVGFLGTVQRQDRINKASYIQWIWVWVCI